MRPIGIPVKGNTMANAQRLSARLPEWNRLQWLAVFLVPALLYLLQPLQADPRLFLAAARWQQAQAGVSGAVAEDYRARIQALPLAGVGANLSGLAWDGERGQLWAVLNNPPELLGLDRQGNVLARHPLVGFEDVEGIAWLGGDRLLLAEEQRQTLVAVAVPRAPGVLRREDYPALALQLAPGENDGFEGLGYDRAGDRLFVVKEHSPRKLYEIRGLRASLAGPLALQIIDRSAWIRDKHFAADFSAVEYDHTTGHLLLLSDVSQLVMEIDRDGRMTGLRSLRHGHSGLAESVPQAEGLALGEAGEIYVVSEPNLFYAFARP